MKKPALHNKKDRHTLLRELENENFSRITCSFYKYVKLTDLQELRDELFTNWSNLKILGRIYLSEEGINAQLSIPEENYQELLNQLHSRIEFEDIPIKNAIDEGISFLKLIIKVKNEIVAYKVSEDSYDINNVGNHLEFDEFNQAIDDGAVVVDMRNRYESEVGKFENAITPDIDRSEDLLPNVKKLLQGHQDDKILMYCTGGIRCEKASAYLIKNGFNDVNQLKGGIIQYGHDTRKNNEKSKFIGKNFVFDGRMGERITDEIISKCHQCNDPSDNHTNCKNQACHILFIQCRECGEKFDNCCSTDCAEFIQLPISEQKRIINEGQLKFNAQKSKRLRPKLNEII